MQNYEFNDWCEENGVRINSIIHISGVCSLYNHSILKSLVDDDAPIIRKLLDLEALDYINYSQELAKKLIGRKILGFFVKVLFHPASILMEIGSHTTFVLTGFMVQLMKSQFQSIC